MTRNLSFLLVVLLGCVACNDNASPGARVSPKPGIPDGKTVFVLFDLSDSAAAQETRRKYAEAFARVVACMNGGDVIVADAITENPLAQSSFPINDAFPPFEPGTDNDLLVRKLRAEHEVRMQERRDEVLKKSAALLTDTSRSVKETHILEAMLLAKRVFGTYDRPKNVLVVFSDMVEESSRANFARDVVDDGAVRRILDGERKADRLPKLSGVKVYVVGAATPSSTGKAADRFLGIERFWLEYFKAAGADLSEERYGAALLAFEE